MSLLLTRRVVIGYNLYMNTESTTETKEQGMTNTELRNSLKFWRELAETPTEPWLRQIRTQIADSIQRELDR